MPAPLPCSSWRADAIDQAGHAPCEACRFVWQRCLLESGAGFVEDTASVTHIVSTDALIGVCELLADLVSVPWVQSHFKTHHSDQAALVLNAMLRVRGLAVQRSPAIEKCASLLQKVVQSVYSDSDDDKRSTIKAYVLALGQTHTEKRTPIFILEQICNIIRPKYA